MFRVETTELPVKLTRNELQDSPIKRKATGKEQGETDTTNTNSGNEVPRGIKNDGNTKEAVRERYTSLVGSLGISELGNHRTITEAGEQTKNARSRQTTTTDKKSNGARK